MLRNLAIALVLNLLLARASAQMQVQAPQGPTVQGIGTIGPTRVYNVARFQIPGSAFVLRSASYQDTSRPGDAFLSSAFTLAIMSPSPSVRVATLRGTTMWHGQWVRWSYVLTDDDDHGDRVSLTIKRGTVTLLSVNGPSDQGKFGVLVVPASP